MKRMIPPSAAAISFEHRLQAIFEFATILGSRDERAQIERLDALVLERLGHVARCDPLCDALDDRGLSHPWLADKHRVVLGAPGKHLHRPAHLLVAADDRIQLALARQVGQVACILRQRLVALLGLGIGHALIAAHLRQRLEQVLAAHAGLAQDARCVPDILRDHGQQKVLARNVLVLEFLGLPSRRVEQILEPTPHETVDAAAAHLRLFFDGLVHLARNGLGIGAELAQYRHHDAVLLAQKGAQQMLGRDLLMGALVGQFAGRGQRFLSLDGELVQSHDLRGRR